MNAELSNERQLLEEVAKWKLEAADEDSKRYFFHSDEVDSLENGENSIVIGRKGTGKTAICRFFETSVEYNRFCLKLSFKEFPFNILYSLEDKNFTTPSQYISLWKYFIYNSVLKMMANNEAINPEFKRKIQKLYPSDEFKYIGSLMESWTKKGFGAGIFPVSGNAEVERVENGIEEIWQDLIPAMETMIVRNIDASKYFIVFDELDEDYRNYWHIETRERYIALITSLFKATSNIRRVFADANCKIFPIIFLRDDIYELLSDPDKNKWEDHKVNLVWKKDGLKKMIAFRLARSNDREVQEYDFNTEWKKLFLADTMPVGGRPRKQISSFDYVLALTHARPRDLVRFLRDASRSTIEQGHRRITEDTVRGVDVDFSDHFREELVNEISGLVPDINQLLGFVGSLHKQRFRYRDFIAHLSNFQNEDDCAPQTKAMNPTSIAKILFHFSIIGNAPTRHNRPVFKYQKNRLSLNPSEPLVVHRGLVKTLGLY